MLRLYVDYKVVRGGSASVVNYRKLSVVRAEWRRAAVELGLPTPRARAAYDWLMRKNSTYRLYVERHRRYTHGGALGRHAIRHAHEHTLAGNA